MRQEKALGPTECIPQMSQKRSAGPAKIILKNSGLMAKDACRWPLAGAGQLPLNAFRNVNIHTIISIIFYPEGIGMVVEAGITVEQIQNKKQELAEQDLC